MLGIFSGHPGVVVGQGGRHHVKMGVAKDEIGFFHPLIHCQGKAPGMVDKSGGNGAEYTVKSADKPELTMALDGGTGFEWVIMTISPDAAHMVKIPHIFNKHLEGLAAVNRRAYNSIVEQLKEVAKAWRATERRKCWNCCARLSTSG